jgi:hypothetical protein
MAGMLDKVSDYLTEARVLLQDKVVPYRYPDIDLIANLNQGLLEARRLRPELFLWDKMSAVPMYSATTDPVAFNQQYRVSLLYYIVGRAELRDQENDEDQRAAALLGKFTAQMLKIES